MADLKLLFEAQKQLQNHIHGVTFPVAKVDPERLRESLLGIIGEVGEVMEASQEWKYHRTNKPQTDREHLIEEVADIWKYAINLVLYLGFDNDDLVEAFMKKTKVNFERKESGY